MKPFPIGCVILASGHSERFGSNKLLQDFRGQPLINYILQHTRDLFAKRVVVTRYAKIADICRREGILCLLHNKPYLNDTVRLGLSCLQEEKLVGYAFCTSDQPLLHPASVEKLCQAFINEPEYITRLAYGSAPGNPMIFPHDLRAELSTLPEDKGGGILAKKYPERVRLVQVQDKYELFDIDTVRDLRQCLNLSAGERSK